MTSRPSATPTLFDRSKRAFDVLASSLALIVTAPVTIVLSVLIAVKLGRPVLFRQARPGQHGEVFELVKFRTMLNPDPSRGIETNEDRMTAFGSKLRNWSLDELPSLWNILTGDMSLVGPRPLLTTYLPLYTAEQARRHEVRPGLTGLAQVNGRNQLDWESRFEFDVEYVDNRSWRLDAKILALTFQKVLKREGIATTGHVVGAPFQGREDTQ
ncbi:sugar transferase [Dietzia lutea]|uniref:Bacterial sugar transferase domain-containing protein n=1 Tax=Dietzia lutea TaxID=546160 RepID=A0A2S1R9F5_9ACTN|nr:sugar transferase [Dietzia lutea]AWH92927.1 hypothetical protein A6035_12940 [Dietzia lutea]